MKEPIAKGSAFTVSFVCTGNICRSPMAETVMRQLIEENELENRLIIESAGTGDWHVGEPADSRTLAALRRAGYDGSRHRAKQFDPTRFGEIDLVVAFDKNQPRILSQQAPTAADREKVHLLLELAPDPSGLQDVPDPYYSNDAMFDQVLEMIERSTRMLFHQLSPALKLGT